MECLRGTYDENKSYQHAQGDRAYQGGTSFESEAFAIDVGNNRKDAGRDYTSYLSSPDY